MKKIFIFIFILSIVAGAIGFYYYEKNAYSKEVLKFEILSQEEVNAFDEVEYVVKYKNNGNVVLEDVQLIFDYPENSLPLDNNQQKVAKSLEDIYPGEEKAISFKARVFGKENQVVKAQALLRYQPRNLKAVYESSTTFSTKIKFVPITFEIDLPSKVEKDKDFQFSLNYFSNSDWPLSNLGIKIEYPLGFEFLDSKPAALEKSEWNLSLLNKTEGGRIQIKGKLRSEAREQKIFKAILGIWQNNNFVVLKETAKGTEITETAIFIFQQINGFSNYTANPGELLHYEIFFRNMGTTPYENLFLVAKLEGNAFDFESVKITNGQFNKNENSLLWDWRDVPKLKFLDKGEEGKVDFWINLKKDWDTNSFQQKNFVLKNKVSVLQSSQEFETKINSRIEFSQKGYFQDEVFGNSGPLPPRVGESTTYTIVWQVKNYYNDVKNVKVKATIPQNVKLTGKIFPQETSLTFDSQSREIIWTVGDLAPGDGILNQNILVAFQIDFMPDLSQKGQSPLLISQAKITAEDSWTNNMLEFYSSEITTALVDDPSVSPQMGIVQ